MLFSLAGAIAAAAGAVPDSEAAVGAGAEQDIVVHGRAIEQIGSAQTASEGTVGYADFENKPISRVGELAENVPGLIATQHSGTGKPINISCAASTSITAPISQPSSTAYPSTCAARVTARAISTSISSSRS